METRMQVAKTNVTSINTGQKFIQTSFKARSIGAVFDTDLVF